eukprot:1176002-Pleurochrysis_carterae.AAC.1
MRPHPPLRTAGSCSVYRMNARSLAVSTPCQPTLPATRRMCTMGPPLCYRPSACAAVASASPSGAPPCP